MSADVAQGGAGGADAGRNSTGGTGGDGDGGGVLNAGATVSLLDATLDSDLAQGGAGVNGHAQAGAGGAGLGGALNTSGSKVTVTASTVSNSTARGGNGGNGGIAAGDGGDGQGGGLFAANTTVALINATVADNTGRGGNGGAGGARTPPTTGGSPGSGGNGGAGGAGQGAGLYTASGTITLTSATVAFNVTQAGNGGAAGPSGGTAGSVGAEDGGGFANPGATVNLQNALIAKNTAVTAPDFEGTVATSDHDLVGDGTGSTGPSAANGDQVGTAASPIDPHLSTLGNHGGPTASLALLPGSPAINAGDNNAAPGKTDQRGLARIAGGAIDMGSVEYQVDLAVTMRPIPAFVTAGHRITYVITVSNLGPDPAGAVVMTDALPVQLTFNSLRAPAGWTESFPVAGSTGTVALSGGALAAPRVKHRHTIIASARFTLVVTVAAGTAGATQISNTATVGPTAGDPNSGNNSVTETTMVS